MRLWSSAIEDEAAVVRGQETTAFNMSEGLSQLP
jgi:hypothetical protein